MGSPLLLSALLSLLRVAAAAATARCFLLLSDLLVRPSSPKPM